MRHYEEKQSNIFKKSELILERFNTPEQQREYRGLE